VCSSDLYRLNVVPVVVPPLRERRDDIPVLIQHFLDQFAPTGAMARDPETGRVIFAPPFDEKIGLLILISRAISVCCAIGAGLGLWMCARVLTSNELASVVASATLMTGAAFVYFAHLGNVDAPSMLWFCWSAYFYARLLKTHRWCDALWLGLFGSLAISTKDAVGGMYPGMALMLFLSEARIIATDHRKSRAITRAALQWKWLIGIAAFSLPYLYLNGVFHNPQGYLERMKYWLDVTPDTIHARQHRYPNQFALAWATVRYAAGAIGWPLLAAMIASTLYSLRKHTRLALTVLVPAIGYYTIVIARMDFVYSRFLFPPLALISILVGRSAIDFVLYANPTRAAGFSLRDGARGESTEGSSNHRMPLRYSLLLALVALPTLGYAVAIDAEMIHDSRYKAEAWFRENIPPPSSVGAFSKPQYLPRFTEMGYATFGVEMALSSFDRPQPEYLVLTSYNYEDFDDEQRSCMDDLIAGELGYELTVTFRGRYPSTRSHWLSLAGWYAPTPGKISPTIIVLQRKGTPISYTR